MATTIFLLANTNRIRLKGGRQHKIDYYANIHKTFFYEVTKASETSDKFLLVTLHTKWISLSLFLKAIKNN